MKVEYWSDFVCPYCYIGKTRMKKAIAQLGLEGQVTLEMKAFELDKDAPAEPTQTTYERYVERFGEEGAAEQVEKTNAAARGEGLEFNYGTTLNSNTFDAHRLAKLARSKGNDKLVDLLYDAHFANNEVLADHAVLRRLALEAGLEAEDVDRVLGSQEYSWAVRSEEDFVSSNGLTAVPFFLVDGQFPIPGAHGADYMASVLKQALAAEQAGGGAPVEKPEGQGEACGPGGCD